MKLRSVLFFLTLGIFLMSCEGNLDLCKQTVSYTKATAIYEDLAELRATPLIESAKEIENAGKIYVGENFILIGDEGKGIHVIDNSVRSAPSSQIFLNIPHNKEFFVENNIIYAESHYDMLAIDISNTQSPQLRARVEGVIPSNTLNNNEKVLVGFTYEEKTEKLDCDTPIEIGGVNFFDHRNELIPASSVPSSFAGNSSGKIGTVNRISTTEDYVYMISDDDMYIFNKAGDLTLVNTLKNFDRRMETIYHQDNQLFIGKANGMTVADITSPEAPMVVSRFDHPESCDPVLPHDGVAYVTLRSEGSCPGDIDVLDIVDLKLGNNSFYLNEIGQIQMESPYGMTIADNFLFVGEGKNGLKLFDITNPRSPQLVSWDRNVEAYDVILHPTENIILTAGPDGLSQYENNGSLDLTFLSSVSY